MNQAIAGLLTVWLSFLQLPIVCVGGACLLEEASECVSKVTDPGCIYIFDRSFVTTQVEECKVNYTNDCNTFIQNQWNDAISSLVGTLSESCPPECSEPSQKIVNCRYGLYSGLQKVASDIVNNVISSSSTKCTIALKHIYNCITSAVATCESLEYYAFTALSSEAEAFKQCNISIAEFVSRNQSEEYNNNTTTNTLPDSNSVKTPLLAGLIVTSLIVIMVGGIMLFMWMHGIRKSNYKKAEDGYDLTDSSYSDTSRTGRSWRTRRYVRRDSDDQPTGSLRTPSVQWSRWWTRPGFGSYGTDVQDLRL